VTNVPLKIKAIPDHSLTRSAPHPLIVIGYGNELRGDDAAGPRIARAVAAWGLPGVRALAIQQLAPELAADLAQADCAIFVDAYQAETHTARAEVRALDRLASASSTWHTGDPRQLLALTQAVYGRAPRAWLVAVPAVGFEYGAPLSPAAQAGVESGLAIARDLIRSAYKPPDLVGDSACGSMVLREHVFSLLRS
jgi:hydrogenase maturation protease